MKINRLLPQLRIGNYLCPYPMLDIEVWSPRNGWQTVPFLVDTGTMVSIVPATWANILHLKASPQSKSSHIHVAASTRRGQHAYMRVRFSEYLQNEFTWPCVIADEPQDSVSLPKAAPRSTEEWARRTHGIRCHACSVSLAS